MSSSDRDFDPEIDLLRRYEGMVQTQIDTLNGIDDKAAYVARLVGVLVGLTLSGISIFVGTDRLTLSLDTVFVFVLASLAGFSFFVSLMYAIITYLSSQFEYGPSPEMGEYMADYQVADQEYVDVLLRGYSQSLKDNYFVVVRNSKRFERCLASLLAGLILLFGAATLFVMPAPVVIDLIVAAGYAFAALEAVKYILEEEFLTLDRGLPNDE